jgi:hypothetical protein
VGIEEGNELVTWSSEPMAIEIDLTENHGPGASQIRRKMHRVSHDNSRDRPRVTYNTHPK